MFIDLRRGNDEGLRGDGCRLPHLRYEMIPSGPLRKKKW